jgi:hypothetical protein
VIIVSLGVDKVVHAIFDENIQKKVFGLQSLANVSRTSMAAALKCDPTPSSKCQGVCDNPRGK